ncbi:hypothetical protein JAAARDRAFT_46048 [Jaapia argillacea MUCL 33604]|uniref:Uncharacterized protein n=1 Tax=Jaapia argillacea MUCL 33604 TaxID=933084 RepID=A0A067Q2C2_9AGAM|nr:hypothetical protein JAAARDRAFT_46048 [Jaapia argillacea MUCL 33604]
MATAPYSDADALDHLFEDDHTAKDAVARVHSWLSSQTPPPSFSASRRESCVLNACLLDDLEIYPRRTDAYTLDNLNAQLLVASPSCPNLALGVARERPEREEEDWQDQLMSLRLELDLDRSATPRQLDPREKPLPLLPPYPISEEDPFASRPSSPISYTCPPSPASSSSASLISSGATRPLSIRRARSTSRFPSISTTMSTVEETEKRQALYIPEDDVIAAIPTPVSPVQGSPSSITSRREPRKIPSTLSLSQFHLPSRSNPPTVPNTPTITESSSSPFSAISSFSSVSTSAFDGYESPTTPTPPTSSNSDARWSFASSVPSVIEVGFQKVGLNGGAMYSAPTSPTTSAIPSGTSTFLFPYPPSSPPSVTSLHTTAGSNIPRASPSKRRIMSFHMPSLSLPALNKLGGGSRNKSKGKKKLVVSGLGKEDKRGWESVRSWCESFGEVESFVWRSDGVHVGWKDRGVGDNVCCLQAKVQIRGAGSVNLSWYQGKQRL